MVELIIIACLLKEPGHCEAFRVPFAADMPVAQCLWQSTLQAARWGADHPRWKVRKVRCGQPQV
jgi:hypothetical protein